MVKLLSKKEFDEIYAKVPRITVDLLIRDKEGKFLLTKRQSGFWDGCWHLPGGTVLLGESLHECALRTAKRELNIEVSPNEFLGLIEYPFEELSTGKAQSFSLVLDCKANTSKIKLDEMASEWKFFPKEELPKTTIEVVKEFLKNFK